ncbi:hypothetical protein X975_23649, partial [Stegodyphus mimosarum]
MKLFCFDAKISRFLAVKPTCTIPSKIPIVAGTALFFLIIFSISIAVFKFSGYGSP